MLTRFARRAAARVLTGPLAFLAAGAIDIACALGNRLAFGRRS